MFIEYILTVTVTSVTALTWRALLMNHAPLLNVVSSIPIVGYSLTCGFCFAMWVSLAAVLIHNPMAAIIAGQHLVIQSWIGWFAVAAGVLFLRNLIAILIELSGLVTDMHLERHEKDRG